MESQNIEFRVVIKFFTKEGAKDKEIISAWLMCMVIIAQSIPQWQSGQQNLKVGKITQGQVALLMSSARR